MGSYLNNIKDEFIVKKGFQLGCLVSVVLFFTLFFIISINNYLPGDQTAIAMLLFIIIILSFTAILLKTKQLKIRKTEIEILKIIISFLKKSDLKYDEIKVIVGNIFSIYKKEKIDIYVNLFLSTEINTYISCKILSRKKSEVKYYVLSVLLDLAADDTILTINEEDFITEIRKGLLVHEKTFNYIKNRYIKQGLQEERKIVEEQRRKETRKKLTKAFLPYNAYKILGVSPTITKAQLKKVYRTLAKKYHPDKYYGQSEEVIQKAEDKFQEILEAYEIILKYKKY
ncbi:MAG: DnaJ domain-containing protein [Bacteroidales bacterium]|nr:DnaJ domain-containing protein [Bacteroidales bacterium]